jgi:hypothetical protein
MNQPIGDLERRQKSVDGTTIVLTVVAAVLALWPMSGALFSLWALGSEPDKGGNDAPTVALEIAVFVLPILGASVAWVHARRRRYPLVRVWRRTAVGALIVSAGLDLLGLALLALLVIGMRNG